MNKTFFSTLFPHLELFAGHITVKLSEPINPLQIQIQHFIPESHTSWCDFSHSIAPRNLTLYGWTTDSLSGAKEIINLGKFDFNSHALTVMKNVVTQSFELKHTLSSKQQSKGIDTVTLMIDGNGGNEVFTCLYRIKVYGHQTH